MFLFTHSFQMLYKLSICVYVHMRTCHCVCVCVCVCVCACVHVEKINCSPLFSQTGRRDYPLALPMCSGHSSFIHKAGDDVLSQKRLSFQIT